MSAHGWMVAAFLVAVVANALAAYWHWKEVRL